MYGSRFSTRFQEQAWLYATLYRSNERSNIIYKYFDIFIVPKASKMEKFSDVKPLIQKKFSFCGDCKVFFIEVLCLQALYQQVVYHLRKIDYFHFHGIIVRANA